MADMFVSYSLLRNPDDAMARDLSQTQRHNGEKKQWARLLAAKTKWLPGNITRIETNIDITDLSVAETPKSAVRSAEYLRDAACKLNWSVMAGSPNCNARMQQLIAAAMHLVLPGSSRAANHSCSSGETIEPEGWGQSFFFSNPFAVLYR
jgi:hypothetical protein